MFAAEIFRCVFKCFLMDMSNGGLRFLQTSSAHTQSSTFSAQGDKCCLIRRAVAGRRACENTRLLVMTQRKNSCGTRAGARPGLTKQAEWSGEAQGDEHSY